MSDQQLLPMPMSPFLSPSFVPSFLSYQYKSTYLTGGPLLHDGLSPTVRAYSRISTELKLMLPRLVPLPLSDPYDECKLSSTVRNFIIDLTSNIVSGNDTHRLIFVVLPAISTASSSWMVIGILFRLFRALSDFRFIILETFVLSLILLL